MEEKVGPSKQEEVINSFRLGSLLLLFLRGFFKKLAKCAEWGLFYEEGGVEEFVAAEVATDGGGQLAMAKKRKEKDRKKNIYFRAHRGNPKLSLVGGRLQKRSKEDCVTGLHKNHVGFFFSFSRCQPQITSRGEK